MSAPQPAGRGTHSDGFIGVSVPGSNRLMTGSSKARQNRSSDAQVRRSYAAEGRSRGETSAGSHTESALHGLKEWLLASNRRNATELKSRRTVALQFTNAAQWPLTLPQLISSAFDATGLAQGAAVGCAHSCECAPGTSPGGGGLGGQRASPGCQQLERCLSHGALVGVAGQPDAEGVPPRPQVAALWNVRAVAALRPGWICSWWWGGENEAPPLVAYTCTGPFGPWQGER